MTNEMYERHWMPGKNVHTAFADLCVVMRADSKSLTHTQAERIQRTWVFSSALCKCPSLSCLVCSRSPRCKPNTVVFQLLVLLRVNKLIRCVIKQQLILVCFFH